MFKVGDKVKARGVEGVVIGIGVAEENYPIWVSFKNGKDGRFTMDGKQLIWHKEPSLVLVERDEKFEEVVGYIPLIKGDDRNYLKAGVFESIADALKNPAAIGYQEVKYFRKVE